MKRTSRMILMATAAMMAAAGALANAPTYTLAGAGGAFSPFAAARAMTRADGEGTTFIQGIPGAPAVRMTTEASENPWLAENPAMLTMAIGAPTGGVSRMAFFIHAPRMVLASAEGGFAFERSKPDLYLGDALSEPEGVDWDATYKDYLSRGGDGQGTFLFDPHEHRVYAALGEQVVFRWVLEGGTVREMTYNVSPACSGRPRRIYWTDHPYNAPAIDLSGKFVKFFGPDSLLKPVYGSYTNSSAGIEQVITNRIVSGLWLDPTTHMLYAYGELQGQVLMAYYETGTFEKILHVQVVEICRPAVNRMTGEIGRALKADGRGYPTEGLRPRPTVATAPDNRGDYYYQHQGQQSYSPKHGNVYPLRPTADCPWNMEVYWMETDEMLVDWPFELDQYACDWPEDATVCVRGDVGGDGGRPVYIPSDYTGTLMSYQDPEGHAKAVEADGTFATTGSGWSLLKLTADDNVWFVPVRSVPRGDTGFFTLEPESWLVGRELELRGGSAAGLAPGFSPKCDPSSPAAIYEVASDPVWNPDFYRAPQSASAGEMASVTNLAGSAESESDTNEYASVVYPVRPGRIEVWWNTVVQEEDMPSPLEIPTLPQVYDAEWPIAQSVPQIVLASQLGSASESLFTHNAAIYLAETGSVADLPARRYFDAADGGTAMFWVRAATNVLGDVAIAGFHPEGADALVEIRNGAVPVADGRGRWRHVAVTLSPSGRVRCLLDGAEVSAADGLFEGAALNGSWVPELGRVARDGSGTPELAFGEILLWNRVLSDAEIAEERYKTHSGRENHLTGCYVFRDGEDLEVTGTEERFFTEKVLGTLCTATRCLMDMEGPPAIGTGVIEADEGTTPKVYVQNDPSAVGYNPNEEHAIVRAGSGGWVAWALRCDLNTAASSAPGVLVEYAKDGRRAMQWFAVAATNEVYPELAADCVAGKAFPGPHPIDFFENPWCAEDTWDEAVTVAPAFRDRKGQLWARSAGTATMRMFYRMQDGFAFPSIPGNQWPAVGTAVPWLSLLDGNPASSSVLSSSPHAWTWRVSWPETVPEMEIGRTLTTASSGLPEVWDAKSIAVVWPPTDKERDATARLFDPTVAQASGFSTLLYGGSVAAVVKALGIKQGAGGNATLRKGRWTFDGLPPSVAGRFYLDTTADIGNCLKFEGQKEDNPSGVSLLHVNVPNAEERGAIASLLHGLAAGGSASSITLDAWDAAVSNLATGPVLPSPHVTVSTNEDRVAYVPRDHYAIFSMGATNYVTLIENDSTNALMGVNEGDPVSMHVFKVVPKYYTGRVVTREDPVNLLSQQLSVIYEEAFAGKPEDYVFEWRKCRPRSDGTVPTDFEEEYAKRGEPEAGLTRFVVGGQGDTLDNMVNTYYAMRYRAAGTNSPAWAAMGDAWSEWTDPPALAEGWVQRVLNNVTPFAQRMRDLAENEAETAVSMIRQAGAPYEGDVALNQDNLPEVGLIQLYETLLSKAESLSLAVGIDDADANKQLQLAVARLADLYGVLGDEAWTDALNPTIGFGGSFGTDYGALSSALFAFDNQVPTLLDEELALLRGRTGENAPSTHLSPYYNRLVWNFTRGITAGEVAYAVNYDISGDNKGVIDYQQAAEMFPQGHGDAYGHYLSALSGYYRLLRNPFFSWGSPAMGEMVVADSVVNVDYYDEAKFAKAAYDVAKTAAAVVDRTARKAVRDNAGAAGAGYLDEDPTRAFGWGEWASRGGFGALANWAVGNALLPETPDPGRYWHLAFEKDGGLVARPTGYDAMEAVLGRGGPWTIEFQANVAPDGAECGTLLSVVGATGAFGIDLAEGDALVAWRRDAKAVTVTNTIYYYTYVSATGEEPDSKDWPSVKFRDGNKTLECAFHTTNGIPDALPEGYDLAAALAGAGDTNGPVPPQWEGWVCQETPDETTGTYAPYTYATEREEYAVDEESVRTETRIGTVPRGRGFLVALRSTGAVGTHPVVSVFDATKAKIAEAELGFDLVPTPGLLRFGAFDGEAGELRHWKGRYRTDAELIAKVACVSPLSDGLVLYLRTIADTPSPQIADTVSGTVWELVGGHWIASEESGLTISFDDEGLKRIDRGSVRELASLASLIPDIQRKVDRLDAGLSPIGLADGAMAFDLTPIKAGDGGKTHFEQIRERAGIALDNARRSLDKAQKFGSRLRLLQEGQVELEDGLETMELETKNKLIEYFGYPYEGDIGPSGTYPQGYDGPDIYNYAWMDLAAYGLTNVADTVPFEIEVKSKPKLVNFFIPTKGGSKHLTNDTWTFTKSATGFILKPSSVTGRRRAQGKIQDAIAEFLCAYAALEGRISFAENKLADFESTVTSEAFILTSVTEVKAGAAIFGSAYNYVLAGRKAALRVAINSLETMGDLNTAAQDALKAALPKISGAGMTVNVDPSALASAVYAPNYLTQVSVCANALLAAKDKLTLLEAGQSVTQVIKDSLTALGEAAKDRADAYAKVLSAWYELEDAQDGMLEAYRELQARQAAVETVVAEAERVIDERTLARAQAADEFTKARYNEMFFRLVRNNALSRYDAQFELAQKYAWLAAQAYDYETGLISSDRASGEAFLARIVGARTLGEFDGSGNPTVASDAAKGDGGLAAILAEMDENWLVLKPRLGINNPQPYATWFSLRHDLFRILDGQDGDRAWKDTLRKYMVDDLRAVPEFTHYCQPLAGSTAEKEPGLVIPFPSVIAAGVNFFGNDLAGGDAALDPTWYATHVSAAGVHFVGYDAANLSRTPSAYLVPVGEDRMRAVGDPDTVLSWKVVDQTIPAPYAIGSAQLDDPDWTPLFDGATGGNDLGARIRKHPSFRAYYAPEGTAPSDSSLDCTRLVGRSAWNTRWLLVIPASSLGSDRETALAAFVNGFDADRDGTPESGGVSDIRLGLKTYSTSGN